MSLIKSIEERLTTESFENSGDKIIKTVFEKGIYNSIKKGILCLKNYLTKNNT